jgi:hypothetical protein
MTEIELKISDDPVPKDITDTAASILAEHTTKSGGLQPATKPFSVLAYMGQDLSGGLIGIFVIRAVRRERGLYDPT